ncbi:MAG: thiolase domain-containing protein, partial [Candidatus Andersenbacteria bacterium]|nr:thiolase domain-containing protein [Candidatus Andersenbacteria bacterium]
DLASRASLVELAATRRAAERAYRVADVTPQEIDLAEVHDCFTIAEVLAIEDLGFVEKGEGGRATARGVTAREGRIPVNVSGGLKASGHPVGATGVKQLCELTLQLRGEAEARQVQGAEVALAQNVGGSGGTAVVSILKRI